MKVIVPKDIDQAQLSAYKPAGSYIWEATNREAWCGHMPPRKRISAAFKDFDDKEVGAGYNVLQRLWNQKAELEGCEVSLLVTFA